MKQLIEYFDRAYIINLVDRADRRRQVEREFHRVGIKIPDKRVQFYNAVRPTDKGRFEDIGTRGCFESHRAILETADREGFQDILIFEDDVSFRDVGSIFEQKLIERLSSEEWDLVFFGYSKPSEDSLTGPLMRWQKDILGAHFYGINGRFIRRMLQYMNDCELRPRDHPDGGPMPADGVYNHIRYIDPSIRLFVAVPNLAYQRSSRTDIARQHILDDAVWLRPAMLGIRAVKHWIRMALDRKKIRRQLD
jgi:glycosyl transferase, family 25